MRYAIVIEKAESNYAAYVPDLPGCVATGMTVEETEQQIREAIEFHIRGLRDEGLSVPEPTSRVHYVEVAA
jgi:predicted RNase H-like HicB family nuclease